ncbi:MAG: radical SAM protein [Gemmatimonadetes bacterium]|nr:radical SAM protein [Gemmatimonadota bacterium]
MSDQSPFQILREPVLSETRANLARSRARLLPQFRTPQQMLGRQGNGCGATIGAMPRCDFACRGCYLGDEANRIPAASVEEVKAQMRALRPLLGNAGNLQLTDGEVTLRPAGEIVELLQYATSLGLIPMLMTHGDSFRRQPGLLERLIVEGGLREVSIHVDTTQRGRRGDRWRAARTEAELNPLRDEFAAMLRDAARATGAPVRGATTMTVTRENLDGVPDVMRWLLRNADVFRLVSFQPIAQVGRTEEGLGGGVTVDELWDRIAHGLGTTELSRAHQWLGHPGCNRFVHGIVATGGEHGSRYLPVRVDGDGDGPRIVDEFLDQFGGVTFRRDAGVRRWLRAAALAWHAPRTTLGNVPAFVRYWLRRLDPGHPWRAAANLLRGRTHLQSLVVVSHHFMSTEELTTPLGEERLAHCVFHVHARGETMSMCEANARDGRTRYYQTLQGAKAPDVHALAE